MNNKAISGVEEIRKVLAVLGISTEITQHESGEEIKLAGTWVNVHCHVPGGTSSFLKTDSLEEIVEGEYRNEGGYLFKQSWSAAISKATYVVELGEKADGDGRVERRVWTIHIWGSPEVNAVITTICEWLRGKDATAEMLEAEKNGHIQEWVRTQISAGSTPKFVRLGSVEFPLCIHDGKIRAQGEYSFPEHHHAVARVFNRLSNDELIGMLPDEQRVYASALGKVKV